MKKFISLTLSLLLFWLPSQAVSAQPTPPSSPTSGISVSGGDHSQLSVPLLAGRPAPFSGILISESDAAQAIEDSASVSRLTIEVAVRTHELELTTTLRDQFEEQQRARIEELSTHSWWDDNGNIFMLGLGLILGVAASALIAGLVR